MEDIKKKMNLASIDDLFTVEKERIDETLEKVIDINLNQIDNFPNYSFRVIDNDELLQMSESIKDKGVLIPALVRKKDDGRYEMISSYRRKTASELANMLTIPCIVRNLSDDEAIIAMVDSNMQIKEILPSERSYAYKMKLEALNHQGKTSVQVGQKYSRIYMSEELGVSETQIQRYIRLTKLIPELLEKVDNREIAFNPGVELSYLKNEEQYWILDSIDYNDATPSHAQTIQFKNLSKSGNLTPDTIDNILSQEKSNQILKIKFNKSRIKNVLPKEIEKDKIEDFVVKSIEFYAKYLRQREALDQSR